MKLGNIIRIVFVTFALAGCGEDGIFSGSDVCDISKSGTTIICFSYGLLVSNETATADCDTQYSKYQTSNSADGKFFTSALLSPTCSSANTVGTCTVLIGITATYYSPEWNTSTGTADCTGVQGGTWD